jgi:hypothetical protein
MQISDEKEIKYRRISLDLQQLVSFFVIHPGFSHLGPKSTLKRGQVGISENTCSAPASVFQDAKGKQPKKSILQGLVLNKAGDRSYSIKNV